MPVLPREAFDAAIAQIQQNTPAAFANDPRIMTYLGYCQKFAGHSDEARATFTRAAAAMKPTPDSVVVIDARNLPCYLAWVYAGLGEKEKALEQARHAITDYHNDALVKPFAKPHWQSSRRKLAISIQRSPLCRISSKFRMGRPAAILS